MTKIKRRMALVSLLCFAISLMIMPIGAALSDECNSTNMICFSVNEYDLLMQDRENTAKQLLNSGYSSQEIASSRTFLIENALYQRAQLSEAELAQKYGYSQLQIDILKAYDGRDLKDYPQIRLVAANLSGSISSPSHSNQSITAKLVWSWSGVPAFYSYTDVLAVRWQGLNASAQNISLALNTNNGSTASVAYYDIVNQSEMEDYQYLDFRNISPYEHAEVALERMSSSLSGFAKSGVLQVRVDVPSTTSASIAEASFIFVYGMTTNNNSYSIGFPLSFSITFGSNTTQALYKAVTIRPDGTITNY